MGMTSSKGWLLSAGSARGGPPSLCLSSELLGCFPHAGGSSLGESGQPGSFPSYPTQLLALSTPRASSLGLWVPPWVGVSSGTLQTHRLSLMGCSWGEIPAWGGRECTGKNPKLWTSKDSSEYPHTGAPWPCLGTPRKGRFCWVPVPWGAHFGLISSQELLGWLEWPCQLGRAARGSGAAGCASWAHTGSSSPESSSQHLLPTARSLMSMFSV